MPREIRLPTDLPQGAQDQLVREDAQRQARQRLAQPVSNPNAPVSRLEFNDLLVALGIK